MDKKTSESLLLVISISVNFIATVILFLILKELKIILIPLVLAFFIYFIFKPINDYLKSKKLNNLVCLIVNFLIFIFIAFVFSQIIITSFDQLLSNVDVYSKKIPHIINSILREIGVKRKDFYNAIASIDIKSLISTGIITILDLFNLLFFMSFFYIFIFLGADKLFITLRKYFLPDKSSENYFEAKIKLVETFNNIINQIQKYIYVKFTNNLLAGLTVTIVLYALGLDYPIIWGLLLFIFEFVPTIGSFLSLIFPTLMSIIQKESLGYTLTIVISLVLIQTFYFSFLEPKRMGNKLGLNPIVILISLLLWNYIWGIPGMILSVPMMATIKIILSNTNSKILNVISDIMG